MKHGEVLNELFARTAIKLERAARAAMVNRDARAAVTAAFRVDSQMVDDPVIRHTQDFEGTADWMSVLPSHVEATSQSPGRLVSAHPSIFSYEVFDTARGGLVLVAVQNEGKYRAPYDPGRYS